MNYVTSTYNSFQVVKLYNTTTKKWGISLKDTEGNTFIGDTYAIKNDRIYSRKGTQIYYGTIDRSIAFTGSNLQDVSMTAYDTITVANNLFIAVNENGIYCIPSTFSNSVNLTLFDFPNLNLRTYNIDLKDFPLNSSFTIRSFSYNQESDSFFITSYNNSSYMNYIFEFKIINDKFTLTRLFNDFYKNTYYYRYVVPSFIANNKLLSIKEDLNIQLYNIENLNFTNLNLPTPISIIYCYSYSASNTSFNRLYFNSISQLKEFFDLYPYENFSVYVSDYSEFTFRDISRNCEFVFYSAETVATLSTTNNCTVKVNVPGILNISDGIFYVNGQPEDSEMGQTGSKVYVDANTTVYSTTTSYDGTSKYYLKCYAKNPDNFWQVHFGNRISFGDSSSDNITAYYCTFHLDNAVASVPYKCINCNIITATNS